MTEPCSEDRAEPRFDHISLLQVKHLGSGEIYEARMYNYNNGGIYFESDGLLQKGTKIYLCMQDSPFAGQSSILEYNTGKVMWREELKRSFFKYGYGIQFVFGSGNKDSETNGSKAKDLRKQSRKIYCQNILYRTQKGLHTGTTKNISSSGVFIATEENLKIGQQLKISLPLKKGKSAEITGQIVWLSDEGFGVKFQMVN